MLVFKVELLASSPQAAAKGRGKISIAIPSCPAVALSRKWRAERTGPKPRIGIRLFVFLMVPDSRCAASEDDGLASQD